MKIKIMPVWFLVVLVVLLMISWQAKASPGDPLCLTPTTTNPVTISDFEASGVSWDVILLLVAVAVIVLICGAILTRHSIGDRENDDGGE